MAMSVGSPGGEHGASELQYMNVVNVSDSAHESDSIKIMLPLSRLDRIKMNAPWRRRVVNSNDSTSSPSLASARSVSALPADGNDSDVVPEMRREVDLTELNIDAKQRSLGSNHLFLKNTFIDVVDEENDVDAKDDVFAAPRLQRANSDSCICYGSFEASDDEHQQSAEDTQASFTPWIIWWSSGCDIPADAYANADGNLESEVPIVLVPLWFPENDNSMNSQKHEFEDSECWSSVVCARERCMSMAASSVSTAATADDISSNMNRTNVLLRNIPSRFTREMLVKMLDSEGFEACYNFIYLPCDFVTENTLGYAFVNMVTNEEANRALAHFKGFCDWKIPSSRVCETSWGREGADLFWHIQRYRNSSVMHHSVPEKFRPALFCDGVQISFPPPTRQIPAPRCEDKDQQ